LSAALLLLLVPVVGSFVLAYNTKMKGEACMDSFSALGYMAKPSNRPNWH
jgi:hypothetical protein